MSKKYLYQFFIFSLFTFPTLSFANVIDDFFKLFSEKHHYSIYRQNDKSNWLYDCKINADRVSDIRSNIKDISFNKTDKSIRFIFDEPEHPFYKVTSIKKIKKGYRLFFQDKEMGVNFWSDVTIGAKGFSSWNFDSKNEAKDVYLDRSFEMISFNETPKINILNLCKE